MGFTVTALLQRNKKIDIGFTLFITIAIAVVWSSSNFPDLQAHHANA